MPDYKEAIALLVLGQEAMIEEDAGLHFFKYWTDGDGWNEPHSESSGCECGWEGMTWVQVDRACSGRPEIADHVLLWVQHIQEDVWREDDAGIPQDSNAVQA